MQSRSPIARIVATLFAAMMAVTCAASAHAQETSYSATFNHNTEAIPVNVLVGQSRVINFDHAIGRFSVSNPEIAEAVLVAPDQVLVNGKAFGQVNFIAWEQAGGKFLVFDVFVRTNLSLIDSQIRALFPKDDIRLSQANGSVVISGSVADAKTVAQVQSVVEAAGFKTVNMLSSPARGLTQIQLQVRVAEVSRSKMRDLAFSPVYQSSPGHGAYTNTGSGPYTLGSVEGGSIFGSVANTLNVYTMAGNAFLFLRALQTQGALRELAEPNLIAMDGQQASFLAGGEFPVPIVQNGGGNTSAVSVMFKEYGVRLNFKPTIIDEDHIRLELEPEVSTIDFANGVKFNGFIIPALKTRRAKTGVELRDGQSFALAGLLDNTETKSLSKIPVLGDVPILGALFRSKNFQSNETELMFIVTAQVVKPVNRDDLPQMRGIDGLKQGSPLGIEPKGEGIQGKSGFSTGGTSQNSPQPAPAQPAPPSQPAPSTTPARAIPAALPSTGDSIGFLSNLPSVSFDTPGASVVQVKMETAPQPK
jgi:pilus assembly protein CpaC